MPRELVLGRPRRSRLPWVLALGIGCGVACGFFALATFRTGDTPELTLETDRPAVGQRTALTVRAGSVERGVSQIRVTARQGERQVTLVEEGFEVPAAWTFWAAPAPIRSVKTTVGTDNFPDLQEGSLHIEVVAQGAGTWLFAPEPARQTLELPVYLRPPSLAKATKTQIIVEQGGAEAVVYSVGTTAESHGVLVDERVFPGVPLGDTGLMFALFAIPYDRDTDAGVVLFAQDPVDNRVELPFIDRFKRNPMSRDTIRLSTRSMQVLVDSIMARVRDLEDQGDLLANYIQINDELRRRNDRQLHELGKNSAREFFWSEPFLQMPAKVVSTFADRRTYFYQGEPVDRQDHLGFDLASVRQDSVPAANRGRVVMADYFGIYGNCVVLDHGYGLMSLYAHLSSFSVEEGQMVERGQEVGRTGTTGLALGDHLHFSMLLRGLAVNPLEWWDGRWIENRIASKLRPVLSYAEDR